MRFPRATRLVILAYDVGDRMTKYVNGVLDRLGLSLNRDKTRIVDLRKEGERLDFLGFTFRFDRNRLGSGKYLNVVPSVKSLNRVRERLRLMTQRQVQPSPEQLIAKMNRFLLGWRNYFSFGYPGMAFREVNWFVQKRWRRFLRTRSQRHCKQLGSPSLYHALKAKGLIYL